MDNLDLLKKVKKVDAPPFILTRIRSRIREHSEQNLPFSLRLAGCLLLVVFIILNFTVIDFVKKSRESLESQDLTNEAFFISNQIYHE
jgi:hypothetical protein